MAQFEYLLSGSHDRVNHKNLLSWTYPGFQTINTVLNTYLFVQRSLTEANQPPEGLTFAPTHPNWYTDFDGSFDITPRTAPAPEAAWSTIWSWSDTSGGVTTPPDSAYEDEERSPVDVATRILAYRVIVIYGLRDANDTNHLFTLQMNWNVVVLYPAFPLEPIERTGGPSGYNTIRWSAPPQPFPGSPT